MIDRKVKSMNKKPILGMLILSLFIQSGCSKMSEQLEKESQNEEFGKESVFQENDENQAVDQLQDNLCDLDTIKNQMIHLKEKKFMNLNLENTYVEEIKADNIFNVTFSLPKREPATYEKKFFDRIRYITGEDYVDEDYITCFVNLEEHKEKPYIPYKETEEDDRINRVTSSIYNNGKQSVVLYGATYMCEIADNTVPTALSGDDTDYTENAWGYRALDLGNYVETYDVILDDISEVSYMLNNEDVKLEDSIDYVEEMLNGENSIVFSEKLDYEVYKVVVRELLDENYYYEMEARAVYKGIPLDVDDSIYMNKDDLTHFADKHRVSVFRNDGIDYMWLCCNSYSDILEENTIQELYSFDKACEIVAEQLSDQKLFEISSVSMIYQTEFLFENDEYLTGEIYGVRCTPVYHFVVGNPSISGYKTIMFDVNAITGEFDAKYL